MKKIKLTRGKYALVDDADYEYLNQWKWNASPNRKNGTLYARRWTTRKVPPRKTLYMHTQLLGEGIVDHINRNGLDNRRNNLRIVNRSQNQWNRKIEPSMGIRFDKRRRKKKFCAVISANKKHYFRGYFLTKKEAKQAYKEMKIKYHGI